MMERLRLRRDGAEPAAGRRTCRKACALHCKPTLFCDVCYRVAALERLRLEDARELSRLQAEGKAARAAGARLAAVLEALLLAAAAKQRQQHRLQQQHQASALAQAPAPAAAGTEVQHRCGCTCGRHGIDSAARQTAAADPLATLPPPQPAAAGGSCPAAASASHVDEAANEASSGMNATAAARNLRGSAAAAPGWSTVSPTGLGTSRAQQLISHPGALPDPGGRLALLQLREALDV